MNIKKKQASERNQIRAQRTPREQLEVLDARLGKDHGACKERARLFIRIDLEEYAKELRS